MAQIETNTDAGEMTQRFIEFVMMQSQNAALFLGQIPNPQTGEPEINLEVARMFIDQLVMIRAKTRGNLTKDEEQVLANAISGLQMAFVEASKGGVPKPPNTAQEPATSAEPAKPPEAQTENVASAPAPPDEGDSKKRFTKSYG